MLDLQASIHLHEVVLIRIIIEDELDSSRAIVTHSLGSCNSCLTHFHAELVRDTRRSLLNDFLVAALNCAITLVHMNVVAMLITENLNLNVSWVHNILLNDHVIVVEALHRLALRRV